MLRCAAVRSHRVLLETGLFAEQHDSARHHSRQARAVEGDAAARSAHAGTAVDPWRDFIESTDMDAAEAVLRRQPQGKTTREPCVAKLAFLFLVIDKVETEEVWDAFFADVDQTCFSVYMHRAAPTTSQGSFQHLPNAVDIPFTRSSWCALLGAELALFHEALKDPRNQQFVLASHDTVPLKSFRYIYDDLIAHSSATSKLCFASSSSLASCPYKSQEGFLAKGVAKHHEWLILSRSHAEIVCAHARPMLARYYALSKPGAANSFMCSDEAGPAIALLSAADGAAGDARPPKESIWERFDRAGVEQRCTTFVYWDGCFQNSTLDLKMRDPSAPAWHPHEFADIDGWYLYKLVNSSLLFARKFLRNASVATGTGTWALARVLPSYWAEAEFRPGFRPPVMRLDSTGFRDTLPPSGARNSTGR